VQSSFVSQRRPLNWRSTPSAVSVSGRQAIPVPSGEHALFDGDTTSARKLPSTSATIGFSYQVHDELYWLKRTSPVWPL
jgi:hypothetical protein